MHYLISKALSYGPCVTKGSHSLPATHTRTTPAFTPQPQGITALWPVPTYTAVSYTHLTLPTIYSV